MFLFKLLHSTFQIEISNPSLLPEPGKLKSIEEPYVRVSPLLTDYLLFSIHYPLKFLFCILQKHASEIDNVVYMELCIRRFYMRACETLKIVMHNLCLIGYSRPLLDMDMSDSHVTSSVFLL